MAAVIAICSTRAPGIRSTTGKSASVVAPLAILAGSYATIAMLLAGEAEAFLERQRVRYLLVRADGSVVCDTVPAGRRRASCRGGCRRRGATG